MSSTQVSTRGNILLNPFTRISINPFDNDNNGDDRNGDGGKNINENKDDEGNISPTSSTTLALPTIKDSEGNEIDGTKSNGDNNNENKDPNMDDVGEKEEEKNNEETSKNINNFDNDDNVVDRNGDDSKNINENKEDEDNSSPTSSTTLALPTIKDSEGNEKGDIKSNGDSNNENKDPNMGDVGDKEGKTNEG